MWLTNTLKSLKQLFLFSLLVLATSAYAENKITLKYAFSDGDPPTSYSEDAIVPLGILPELAHAVFKRIETYGLDAQAYPWPRAKLLAQNGQVDGLLTYPSKTRQEFMLFSEEPTYISDYGYIIFNKDNENAALLEQVSHYEELSGYTLVTEGPASTDSWEEENLPLSEVARLYLHNITQIFHRVFLRNNGDFFIRNLEEAKYMANQLGYGEKLRYKKVQFKTENTIPFHLGIQKSHPQAQSIINRINDIQRSKEFKIDAQLIISSYQ